MTARFVALCTALSLSIGCASYRSQYARNAASPGELVWRFDDDQLQVTRDGQLVAQAGSWDGLASAVACVPAARDWASTATDRYHGGTAMLWTGTLGAIATAIAGTALIASDTHSEARVGAGLSLTAGGLLAGLIVAAIGGQRRMSGEARGIDAINLYNDQIASGAGCPRSATDAAAH